MSADPGAEHFPNRTRGARPSRSTISLVIVQRGHGVDHDDLLARPAPRWSPANSLAAASATNASAPIVPPESVEIDDEQASRGVFVGVLLRVSNVVLRGRSSPSRFGSQSDVWIAHTGAVMPADGGVTGRDFRKRDEEKIRPTPRIVPQLGQSAMTC